MTLRCWQLAIPFRSKFTHNRKSRSVSSTFWVQAEQDGMVGFGEGCPRPYVTGETLDQCQLFFNRHSKQVSAAITDLPSLKAYRKNHEMDIAANPAAWCAIELALLDLIARLQQVPVERLLGLPDLSGSFRYTGVLGVDAPEAFARKLQAHRSLGMHDYKLKWNADNASSRARLEQIQSAVPGVMIRIDANNLWPSAAAAIQELKALADSVWAVEEPLCLPSLQDALNIARQTGVRIILDEAVLNERDLLPYLDYAEHFILNLRVSKCGGLLSSLAMAQRCLDAGMQAVVGAQVGETSVLTRVALPVARVLGKQCKAQEGAYGVHLLERDVVEQPLQFGKGGTLFLSDQLGDCGWGLNCDLARLD